MLRGRLWLCSVSLSVMVMMRKEGMGVLVVLEARRLGRWIVHLRAFQFLERRCPRRRRRRHRRHRHYLLGAVGGSRRCRFRRIPSWRWSCRGFICNVTGSSLAAKMIRGIVCLSNAWFNSSSRLYGLDAGLAIPSICLGLGRDDVNKTPPTPLPSIEPIRTERYRLAGDIRP